jgi:ubiquinone/menaquinone biosynthesis C-methylase UbiE
MTQRSVDMHSKTTVPYNAMRFTLWLFCLLLLAPLQADEQSVRPGINRNYENPDWRQWVQTFESPHREVYAKRQAIIEASAVRPGMSVADIGAGTGLFTRLFAHKVAPTGKVYAVDISATFIDNILRTCREQGIGNVAGVVNPPRETGLPDDSIDLAFVTNTYHHFEYPQDMLASIRRALRRDGRLIIIDFHRDPRISTPWIMGHVRAGKDTIISEIRAAGFRLVDDKPVLSSNYFLVFEKAGQS